MKLVTFNIRCDYGQDKGNCFCFRAPLILKKLAQDRPDVICFQEVLPHVAAWLKENLTDYYVVGCGRSETLRDEQEAVAFRRDAMNLIAMDSFWISPEPSVPGSRYPGQSECPRICTEVLLEDLKSAQVFRVFNLHLDHQGVQARILGLRQLLEKAGRRQALFPDAAVFLCGDFNAEPDGEEMRQMSGYPEYRNVTGGIGITYHGFEPEDEPERIDYIFLRQPDEGSGRKRLRCLSVQKWEDRENAVWLSDHYPVCAEFVWESCP